MISNTLTFQRLPNRCNPIHPDFMTDIADAYESAYTIMLNLNKSWVQKQGDFFVESPIILFAAIIWYLKIYQNGRYCTFPHAIEFLNRRYEDIFPILTSYPELENYLSPFMDAWLGGAAEQLMGQIASAKLKSRKSCVSGTIPTVRTSTARHWACITHVSSS